MTQKRLMQVLSAKYYANIDLPFIHGSNRECKGPVRKQIKRQKVASHTEKAKSSHTQCLSRAINEEKKDLIKLRIIRMLKSAKMLIRKRPK